VQWPDGAMPSEEHKARKDPVKFARLNSETSANEELPINFLPKATNIVLLSL
jgi:hypothetical protein